MTFGMTGRLLVMLSALVLMACQTAPPPEYAYTPPITEKRAELKQQMLRLLPAEQQNEQAAQEEARWLADTAYKAGAAIARYNDPVFMAWMNNRMVNSMWNFSERGLCWHYQHDMYRELRRRALSYFRIGCCVRDKGDGSEHHCVYVSAAGGTWPESIILDPWIWNGRLEVLANGDFPLKRWEDEPGILPFLQSVYPERHLQPFEHWARVKDGSGFRGYVSSFTEEGRNSRQGKLMQQRIQQGLQQRGGKLYNY